MTAGMAGVIAEHDFLPMSVSCLCGNWAWPDGAASKVYPHAAHVAEELAKAGYGNVQEALRTTADEMKAERETWCLDESGRHWIKRTLDDLRQRADAMEAPHGVD